MKKYTESVSVIHPVCCGLDIHKNKISACLLYGEEGSTSMIIREFSAFTDDLVKLREWLLQFKRPVGSMESTGVYWRPVHINLEKYLVIVLVNRYLESPQKAT